MMLSADDRLAILDLYTRYNVLVDSRDKKWANVFTPDGVFSARGNAFKGTTELEGYIQGLIDAAPTAPFLDTQHWNSNIHLAEADEDHVTGTCYLIRVGRRCQDGELAVITLGQYTDQLTRTADGWRFSERQVAV